MRYLFLDDERIPSDVTWLNIAVVEWNIVRSFADAVAWVEANGFPDVVSFDHDLGTLPDKDSSESDTNTGRICCDCLCQTAKASTFFKMRIDDHIIYKANTCCYFYLIP